MKKRVLLLVLVMLLSMLFVACDKKDEKKESADPTAAEKVEEKADEKAEEKKEEKADEAAKEEGVKPIVERGYAKDDLLISAEDLNKKLGDEKVLIFDARGPEAYGGGHIPGSVAITWPEFSDMEAERGKGFACLFDEEKLTPVFQKYGFDEDVEMIFYADPSGWGEDGRLVWMLRMAGLNNSKILDGGFPAWEKAGFEVSKEATEPKASEYKVEKLSQDLNATTDFIKENLDTIKIIDVRAQKEWDGAQDYGEPRGGHIKGAIHLLWTELADKDHFIKTQEEIDKMMADLGITKEDTIVTYCTSGIRSAHMALVLQMAGYENAKNYDASINEWGAYEELPME